MAIFVRSVRTTTLHATTDTLTLQFGIIAICCSLCGSACRSSGQTGEEGKRTVDVQAAEPVPSDFEMVFGEGGGFVGQWSGHTIRADGSVFAWSGPVAGANMDSLGVLDRDTLNLIWERVGEIGFFTLTMEESGNITAFVRIHANGQDARASWIPGVESIEPPRNEVEAFYRQTRTILRTTFR